MTNNDILRADLLDIIFDQRNKDYGAYALRRNYPKHLLFALAGTAAMILSFILLNLSKKETAVVIPKESTDRSHKLIIIELPRIEPPVETRQTPRQKPVEQVASIKHTNQIDIKPDKLVKTTVPTFNDFQDKQIGTETKDGVPKTDIVKPTEPTVNNIGDGEKKTTLTDFIPMERQPEFPGGMAAMMRFLHKHLVTPDELQVGEKKAVMVKFKVDIDGSVSDIKVIQSAGAAFDREVIRVCKKMPRWSPGFQNGMNVPIYYQLPVTFMSLQEEE